MTFSWFSLVINGDGDIVMKSESVCGQLRLPAKQFTNFTL